MDARQGGEQSCQPLDRAMRGRGKQQRVELLFEFVGVLPQLLKLELIQSRLLTSLIQLLLHAKQLSLKVGLILFSPDDFLSLFLSDDKLVV